MGTAETRTTADPLRGMTSKKEKANRSEREIPTTEVVG
jgi:hypothetical protein